jgi:hypothetical protein
VLVLAQQQGLMRDGQVDEFLVVCVAAGHGSLGGDGGDSRVTI